MSKFKAGDIVICVSSIFGDTFKAIVIKTLPKERMRVYRLDRKFPTTVDMKESRKLTPLEQALK